MYICINTIQFKYPITKRTPQISYCWLTSHCLPPAKMQLSHLIRRLEDADARSAVLVAWLADPEAARPQAKCAKEIRLVPIGWGVLGRP